MQSSGADVFSAFIHLPRGFSNLGDTVCTELTLRFSVPSSAWYCSVSEAFGSSSMRSKSFAVSASSSTRIGSRP